MTSEKINSFVGDLVSMAKAFEELPRVERELDQANSTIENYAKTVQAREIHILELKAEIDALHTSIRELEVAKDSAETMFLEADDRTTRALEFVKTVFGTAGSLIQALEPPKPESVSVQVDPTVASTEVHSASTVSHTEPVEQPIQSGDAQPITSTDKPYSGRRYHDVPQYVPYHEWIEGGGTDADYHWRPSHAAPF